MRDRGLTIPVPAAEEEDHWSDEKRLRVHLVLKLHRCLRSTLADITAETRRSMDGFPPPCEAAGDLDDFFFCYVGWLRILKNARKKEDRVLRYKTSVRVKAYDWIFRMLSMVAKLHQIAVADPELENEDFYAQLVDCTFLLGETVGFCDDLAANKLNTPEYVLSAEADRKRGAMVRHAENRGMKDQARKWYASNKGFFRSLDATAEAVQRLVPVTFRTARAWVAEFKAGAT